MDQKTLGKTAIPEGICGCSGVGGSGGTRVGGVPEKEGVAVSIADKEIKIAIGVGIREGRSGA